MRTLSAEKLASKAEQWYEHLSDARRCRKVYRESQRRAQLVYRDPPARIRFASISSDFAGQLSLPLMSDQTMNEFFAEKKGYDVNLF